MRAAICEGMLVVAIGHDEACRVAAGETIGDRIHPMMPDSKITVRPLQDLDPSYEPVDYFGGAKYDERLRVVRCVAQMFEDYDLAIYVPKEVAQNGIIAAETIARGAVQIWSSQYEEQLRAELPAGGINMRFDNGRGLRSFEDCHRRR